MLDERNRLTEYEPYRSGTYLYDTPSQEDSRQPHQPEPEKPRRRGLRTAAAVVALSLVSGFAGGGASYWALRENAQPVAPVSETVSLVQAPTTLPAATTAVTDYTEIVRKAAVSVVEITINTETANFFTGQYDAEGAGSGVILSEDGYIVTNNHVVAGSGSISIRLQDGAEHTATVVGSDTKTDLAVIKIDASGLVPATIADSDTVVVGEPSVAIGNSLGTLGGTVTNGIISAKDREITVGSQSMRLLQTSAAINPGNSGGGLFNADGNLVGIVNAKSAGVDVEGLGFAIPSNIVREVTNELIKNGYVTGRPQLGISIVDVSDPMTAAMYRITVLGVYVAEVHNAGSGLQQGDRIVSIDGEMVRSSADITAVLDKHQVGDAIPLTVDRDGKEVQVSTTLTEKQPEAAPEVQTDDA